MGKSSDEGAKAAKAGMCACGICCALCIGIPLLIIIIIIIIIVVVVGSASDSISDLSANLQQGTCNLTETENSSCTFNASCKGDRTCVSNVCTGTSGCE